jgi:hypothetical protein
LHEAFKLLDFRNHRSRSRLSPSWRNNQRIGSVAEGPQLSEKEVKALFAKHHGVDRAYLNNGKRPVSDSIAGVIGLRKVYVAQNSAKDLAETRSAPW